MLAVKTKSEFSNSKITSEKKLYKAWRHTENMVLSQDDIQERLKELNGWTLKEEKIVKILEFPSFIEAIDFVNKIAKISEIHNHHPIITINWKTVKISLKSFDVNSITERDFSLASAIEEQIKWDY